VLQVSRHTLAFGCKNGVTGSCGDKSPTGSLGSRQSRSDESGDAQLQLIRLKMLVMAYGWE